MNSPNEATKAAEAISEKIHELTETFITCCSISMVDRKGAIVKNETIGSPIYTKNISLQEEMGLRKARLAMRSLRSVGTPESEEIRNWKENPRTAEINFLPSGFGTLVVCNGTVILAIGFSEQTVHPCNSLILVAIKAAGYQIELPYEEETLIEETEEVLAMAS